MKCAAHSELDAIGFCRNCGKALCAQCARPVRGALYCEECLASRLTSAPPAPPPQALPPVPPSPVPPGVPPAPLGSGPSPGLACCLGFIPGVGAVVNGEYLKAALQILIFGSLIAVLNTDIPGGFDALFGIALTAFYFYMPIDAYRVARARLDGERVTGITGSPESDKRVGAVIIICLGAVLLLANLGLLHGQWMSAFWPLALVAIGVWLFWKRALPPSAPPESQGQKGV
jgi:LiaI-LiaF-like transmembrane region